MTALPNFDVWDQATLTDVITKPMPGSVGFGTTGDSLGNRIAPLVPHPSRLAKVRVTEMQAVNQLAQLRAPNADPMLVSFKGEQYLEEILEMVLLDEMHRIMEEDYMKLSSPDENIARSAGKSIIDRGNELRIRNEKRTEWMRWQAFQGEMTLTYPTGSPIYINYGLPAGHKPTVTTLWSNTTTADPIADIEAWSNKLADDSGFPAKFLHMTSKTYRYLVENKAIRDSINFNSPQAANLLRPRRTDIDELMTIFSQDVEIVIYDDGYRDETSSGYGYTSLNRYLPDGKVLVTTDYVLNGVRIADVLDGQVTVSAGFDNLAVKQGEQASVMVDHRSHTYFLRYASARIPRLLIPEAFLWATVA